MAKRKPPLIVMGVALCPTHTRPLICPACIGTKGGKVRSKAKTAAVRKNAAKATVAARRKRRTRR